MVVVGIVQEIPVEDGEIVELTFKSPDGKVLLSEKMIAPATWECKEALLENGTYYLDAQLPSGKTLVIPFNSR